MTTNITVTAGSGKTIATFDDLRKYMAARDLTATDTNVFVVVTGAFVWNDGNAANPAPVNPTTNNRYIFLPDTAASINLMFRDALDYTAAMSGSRIEFPHDSNRPLYPGLVFRDLGVLCSNTSSNRAFTTTNSNSAISDFDVIFERTRWLDSGTGNSNTCYVGATNSRTCIRDSLLVKDGNVGPLVGDISPNNSSFKFQRNTVVARGTAAGSDYALNQSTGAEVSDSIFVGWGSTVVNGTTTRPVNCFTDSTPTNLTGFTKLTTAQLVTSTVTPDYSVPAGSPLLGVGSTASQKTYDLLNNYRGTVPDIGAKQRVAQALPAIPNTTITSITVIGQRIRGTFTTSAVTDSVSITLNPASTANGAVAVTFAAVMNANGTSGTFVRDGVVPGNYAGITGLATNGSGTGTSSGGNAFVVAVPAAPTITIASQSKGAGTVAVSGTSTGNPVSGAYTLTAATTNQGNAVTQGPFALSFADDGTWSLALSNVPYGVYSGSTATATNATATGTTTGNGISLYAAGTQPPGLATVDLPAYSVPVFNAPTLANGDLVFPLVLENTTAAAVTNQPFTIGHPFKQGQLKVTDSLVGHISGQADVPLQFNMLSTWPDGSVRHGQISGIVPALAASALTTMTVTRSTTAQGTTATARSVITGSAMNMIATATIGGVVYTADVDAALTANLGKTWLSGPIATEYAMEVPFKMTDGTVHPILRAQVDVRWYAQTAQAKVDIAMENCDYLSPVADITYDFAVLIAGVSVFSQTGLVHWYGCRFKQQYWYNGTPALNIKHNVPYILDTKLIANFDRTLVIPEATLKSVYVDGVANTNFGPMGFGLLDPHMGDTGGRADIGPAPRWVADYVVSQDKRPKGVSILNASGAGAFAIHFRDRSTGPASGQPVDVMHFPYITKSGSYGDANNPLTGQNEHMPDGTSAATTTPDVSHHPATSNYLWVLLGDRFYLDEVKFWANFCMWQQNPSYRQREKGLMLGEQLRGQAWSMRDIGFLAYLIPDSDPSKPTFQYFLDQNIAWYNATYSDVANPNPTGTILNNALAYKVTGSANYNGMATWQHGFFTYSIGQAVDLGHVAAKRLLNYVGKFSVGCFNSGADYCYIHGATYAVAATEQDGTTPVTSFARMYALTATAAMQTKACGSQVMADQITSENGAVPPILQGEIFGFASTALGYPSNVRPGLAAAVDAGLPGAVDAQTIFDSSTVLPDYASGGVQFAIKPRNLAAVVVTVPSTPYNVVATPSAGSASVTGVVASNGGSAIQSYTATASTGQTGSSASLPVAVAIPAGAANVTFTLIAANGIGSSLVSAASAAVTIPAASVPPTVTGVMVTPDGATVAGGGTQQFAASVQGTNSPSQSVSWSKTSGVGAVTGGLYTAPAATSSAQQAILRATSVQDTSKYDEVVVTIPAITVVPTVTGVTVTPDGATVAGGATQQFAASVQGTNSPSQAVAWSKSSGVGTVVNGLYTAPAATGVQQIAVLRATSQQDASKYDEVQVIIPAASVTPPAYATKIVFGAIPEKEGDPAINATGLQFTVWAESTIGALHTIIAQGNTLNIVNGAGQIDITGQQTLMPGDTAYFIWGDAANTMSGRGPVTVS